MDADTLKQFLAAGNDDGNAQPPAANTRPPPTQASPPAPNVPVQVPHANRSALTSAVPGLAESRAPFVKRQGAALLNGLKKLRNTGGSPSRATQSAGQAAGRGADQGNDDARYTDLNMRYGALGVRAEVAGIAPPQVLACVNNFEQHVNAHRFVRGSPVTLAQLEAAIATFQEEVEYFEGQREMPASLGGGHGRSGFGGGYVFAMGSPGYGQWWY